MLAPTQTCNRADNQMTTTSTTKPSRRKPLALFRVAINNAGQVHTFHTYASSAAAARHHAYKRLAEILMISVAAVTHRMKGTNRVEIKQMSAFKEKGDGVADEGGDTIRAPLGE